MSVRVTTIDKIELAFNTLKGKTFLKEDAFALMSNAHYYQLLKDGYFKRLLDPEDNVIISKVPSREEIAEAVQKTNKRKSELRAKDKQKRDDQILDAFDKHFDFFGDPVTDEPLTRAEVEARALETLKASPNWDYSVTRTQKGKTEKLF